MIQLVMETLRKRNMVLEMIRKSFGNARRGGY